MKKILLLAVVLGLGLPLTGQPTFHHIYDLTNGASENAFDLIPVDGGIYVNCGTWCSEAFDYCPILFKINNEGDSLWHRQYNYNVEDNTLFDYTIDQNEEFLYGCGRITEDDKLPFIVKMNEWGDTVWHRTYYAPYWDAALNIQLARDGQGLVAAVQGGSFSNFADLTVIKTDTAGQLLWSTTIEDSIDYTYVGQLAVLQDASIMLSFYYDTPPIYGRGYGIAKLSNTGEVEWVKFYDELTESQNKPALLAAHPQGGVVTGWAFDTLRIPFVHPDEGPLLRRLDSDGEILWEYKYLDRRSAEITNLTITDNGDIVMCGSAPRIGNSQEDSERAWLARVTADGEFLWKRYYEGVPLPFETLPFNDVAEASDGGLVACTYIRDTFTMPPIPDPDVWLVKTDANGCITPGCQDSVVYVGVEEAPGTGEPIIREVFFKAYPNPTQGPIQVAFFNAIRYEEPELRLFNLQGQQVLRQRLQRGAQSAELSTSGLPGGLYILQYASAGRVLQQERVVKVE